MSHFQSESERLRAREAMIACVEDGNREAEVPSELTREFLVHHRARFDRLYPPMSDAPMVLPCKQCGGLAACWCPLPPDAPEQIGPMFVGRTTREEVQERLRRATPPAPSSEAARLKAREAFLYVRHYHNSGDHYFSMDEEAKEFDLALPPQPAEPEDAPMVPLKCGFRGCELPWGHDKDEPHPRGVTPPAPSALEDAPEDDDSWHADRSGLRRAIEAKRKKPTPPAPNHWTLGNTRDGVVATGTILPDGSLRTDATPVGMHPCRVCGVPVWEEYEICGAECAAKMTPTMECCCNMDAPMPDRECPIHGDPTFTPPAPHGESAVGLSIICSKCGALTSGEEAGDRVLWVICRQCSAPRLSREEALKLTEKYRGALIRAWDCDESDEAVDALIPAIDAAHAALLAALIGEVPDA